MQSWGPPLGSREAVRTLEYTLLHLAGKEVEWGSCYGLNDTLRTSAPLALPHTRQQPPGCLGKKGEEGVHTSVVPEGRGNKLSKRIMIKQLSPSNDYAHAQDYTL